MKGIRSKTGLHAFPMAALIALTIASTTQGATAYKHCKGGANPDGGPGSFYRGLEARGVACSTARHVTREFAYRHSDVNSIPRIHSTTTSWGRWVCHSKFHRTADNGYENVKCRRGPGRKHRVRFYGAP